MKWYELIAFIMSAIGCIAGIVGLLSWFGVHPSDISRMVGGKIGFLLILLIAIFIIITSGTASVFLEVRAQEPPYEILGKTFFMALGLAGILIAIFKQ